MIIYYLFFGSVSLCLLLSKSEKKELSALFLSLSFFLIFLFSGLRGSVGIDSQSYLNMYSLIDSPGALANYLLRMEPGFVFVTYIHKLVLDSAPLYFLFLSFVQTVLFYVVYLKSGKSLLLVLFYVITVYVEMQFNVLRIGIALQFLAISVLETGYKKKSIFFVLSSVFHLSTLAFFPFVIVSSNLPKVRKIVYSLVFFVILFFVFIYFGDYIYRKFDAYFSESESFRLSVSSLLFSILILFSFSFKREFDKLYFFVILFMVFILFFRVYFPIFYRLYDISLFLYLVLGVSYFGRLKFPFRSLSFWFFILFLLINSVLFISSIPDQHEKYSDSRVNLDFLLTPYSFFWEDSYFNF
ncbi:EpsG family protein [Marinobacter daepoensis]|uniref:EpsG family protein n=1 Tax=Marinobacter daepoensis TaxID=262077 RepID=UPI000404FA23